MSPGSALAITLLTVLHTFCEPSVADDMGTAEPKSLDIKTLNSGSVEVYDERNNPVIMTFSVAASDGPCGIEEA
jgi:hypothetical protein